MGEVSGKAVVPYVAIAVGAGMDPAKLFAGLPYDDKHVPTWVTWKEFGQITERMVDGVGADRLADAMLADQRGIFSALRFFARPSFLIRASFDWRGRSLFPCHKVVITDVSARRTRLQIAVPENQGSRAFFELARRLIERLPTLVHLPRASVSMSYPSSHICVYDVELPPSGTLFDRVTSKMSSMVSAGHALDELTSQMEELRAQQEQLIIARDEAEAARTRAELARDVAERALRARSELLKSVSHEVRTPLNGIHGALEMFADTPLAQEGAEAVEIMRASTTRLGSLLGQILDFTSLDGDKAIREQELDVTQLCSTVVSAAAPRAIKKGLTITVTTDGSLASSHQLFGDEERIRQVLETLVDNAVKFSNKGQIHVQATVSAPDAHSHAQLRIQVKDQGVGIPSAALPTIFEPFSRVDGSWTRAAGGLGLGLAISHRLVKMLGGALRAESVLGEGSTFIFELPLSVRTIAISLAPDTVADPKPVEVTLIEAAPESTATPVIEVTPPPPALRVLIVDDDPINRKVLTRFATNLGVTCDCVENGALAVDRFQAEHYDAILMDCQMPVMDGFEATRLIREHELGKSHTLIVAVTANAEPEDRARCKAVGMDDFIAKPVKKEQLRDALVGLLEHHAAAAE